MGVSTTVASEFFSGLLDYDLHVVDLRAGKHKTAEHLKLHPLGKVPALEIDGAVIFESLAIVLYLADRFWEKDLAPVVEQRRARADYLAWMALSTGTLEPAVLDQVRAKKARDKGIETIDLGPASTTFEAVARCVEDKLRDRPFLLGDRLTAADIMNGSMMMWAGTMGLLTPYPNIVGWISRLTSRSAYQRATSK
jgi:glutathione S-transferase